MSLGEHEIIGAIGTINKPETTKIDFDKNEF